jgi:hypothetical protein
MLLIGLLVLALFGAPEFAAVVPALLPVPGRSLPAAPL